MKNNTLNTKSFFIIVFLLMSLLGLAQTPYCGPTYSSGTSYKDLISNVTLNTLNNSSSGATSYPYYTYYNAVTIPDLTLSTTETISITFGLESNQYAAVWIDFNQNNTFESSEGFVSTVNAGSGGTTSIDIPIPATATLGNTRMRVRGGDDSVLSTSNACGTNTWGETEDYIVNIVALTSPKSYSSTGTFTVPAGVTQVTVEAWGGGGSGGTRTSGNNVALAGGGGGAYAKSTTITVTPLTTYTVNVGTGSSSTSAGGDSWFINSTTILAKGGGSVANNSNASGNGGLASASIGSIKYNGGNGATGSGGSFGGGGGSSAGTTLAGNYTNTTTNQQNGATAPVGGGNGGTGAQSGTSGVDGTFPGGGGGGGYRAGNGTTQSQGNGANGQVIISWSSSPPTITSFTPSSGCPGSSITINGTNLTGATTVKIGGTAVASITSNTATQIVAVIGSGTTGTVSVTTGAGTATSGTSFTVNPTPTANAGSALSDICQGGTTVALGGSFGSSATSAIWSTTSGGTFANNTGSTPNTTTWTPAAGFSGTATLILTTSGGTCTAVTASKNQTVNGTPTANAGSTLTAICQGGTTVALGGSYSGAATSAIWSTTSGGTFTNNSGSTPNTTTWTPPAAFTGTATLILTTSGGSCGTTFSSKTQVVNLAPTANAGSALTTICQGGTTATLGGSFGGSATSAIWSTTSGGTFANNTGSTPNTTTWTPAAGFSGTATLILTTSGGSCTATTVSKTQIVSAPIVSVGSALSAICKGSTTAALGGSFGGSATGAIWSSSAGGTFTNNTGTTPSTTTWTPPTTYSGTATLTLTTTGGSCGTTFSSKTQTVDASPTTANAGPNQTLSSCTTATTLAANTATVGSGSWTIVSGIATITSPTSPTSEVTGLALGVSATLRWTISNGSCTNSTSDVIITTVLGSTCSYCVPTYSTGSGSGNNITNVNLGPLNNNSTASSSPYYTFYNAVTIPDLVRSSSVSLAITFGSSSNQYAAVWIDFNQDGTFQTSEGFITSNAGSNGTAIITIPVPADAIPGNTRMRIRGGDSSALTTSQSCGASNSTRGETEDYIVNIIAPITPTIGPGGVVSNLQLWLRSDLLNGTTTVADNTEVNTWNTQARGTNAVQPTGTGAPIYKNNATANINFNSVVDFTNNYNSAPNTFNDNDTTRQYLKGTSGYYTQDMFVVLIPDVTITSSVASNDIFCGDKQSGVNENDGSGIGYGGYTARLSNEVLTYAVGTSNANNTTIVPPNATGFAVANTSTTASYSTPGIINARNNAGSTSQELYFNATNQVNTTNDASSFANINNSQYWIGRSEGWTGSLDARVGEVITYSSRLSDSERNNVQSYLAIKYGITLGVNGTSMNYTNSAGSTIWNISTGTAANDVFNYEIAGIGRDDSAKLNQKQSKSVNTTDDITIGLADIAVTNTANTNTFDSDKKFLVWGNNHGTLAAQSAVVVNMSSGTTPALTSNVNFISVGRTWKVVETGGDVPSTKVSIPTSMLSATITPPGDYLMFISNSPVFNPTAEYRIMKVNGSNLETNYDFNGTKYITFGYAPEKTFTRSITFNGTTNYLDAGNVLDLNTSFTVSAWIKRNGTNQTILSKRNNGFTVGYDLSINSEGKTEMSWVNGTKRTVTSSVAIPTGIWHNVAVTYDGATSKIYIDGVLDTSLAMPTVPANTQSFLIAAADGSNTTSFFKGSIDEVRVWKVALSAAQLRYVMNQEILSNGIATNGSVIPNTITLNDISSIPWANLSAYYPMSTYTFTNAKDISNNNYTAALKNITTVDWQTAPLPYESSANGAWTTAATWLNNTVQDKPNSPSLVSASTYVNWNIVKTNHAITTGGDKTVLGLFVNSNTISATSDSKIEVSNYLKLDGKIDLEGKSQLIQTDGSDLDIASAGSLERDQQGQTNIYNYNYWSSPVSPINTLANNTNFTITGVMKDGFNTTPRDITWISGYNSVAGNTTTPISLSRYWLYKFESNSDNYANWTQILETNSLRVGQGYTAKGASNVTFVGKPNNGTISTNTVSANQLLLVGNPYPSAIDAIKFLDDNVSSVARSTTDGTLYFWQHATENNSHVVAEYKGSYGVLNYAGGIGGITPTGINGAGTANKIPKQYIPVGQGFFVYGSTTGGAVTFKNSQRAFVKEDDATSNTLFKTKSSTKKTTSTENISEVTSYKKIRLGYDTNNNYHRQVLLAFMNEKATSDIDYGYDGEILDDFSDDMYLLKGETQLLIEGEGYFDEDASYPIGVKSSVNGKVSFSIDTFENFDSKQKVYIYDEDTQTYNEIQDNPFEVVIPIGVNNTRFSLRFKDDSTTNKTLHVEDNTTISNGIKIIHAQNENTLVINNDTSNITLEKVTLFNILGQSIASWKIENQEQKQIIIPINNLSSGVYITKLKTSKGEISKKIIINDN